MPAFEPTFACQECQFSLNPLVLKEQLALFLRPPMHCGKVMTRGGKLELNFKPSPRVAAEEGDLIVIEGIDGSGKTGHSKALATRLNAAWRRFPNRETPFGKLIDTHLRRLWTVVHVNGGAVELGTDSTKTDAMAFQALQIANRVEAMEDFTQTLQTQHIVCDRYWPSGLAYGGADGLDKDYMVRVHRGLRQANVYVLFSVEIEEAFKRMGARDNGTERYEGNRDFLRTVSDNYHALWAAHADDPRWVVVDANGSYEETALRLNVALAQAGLLTVE